MRLKSAGSGQIVADRQRVVFSAPSLDGRLGLTCSLAAPVVKYIAFTSYVFQRGGYGCQRMPRILLQRKWPMDPTELMRLAIEKAWQGITAGQSPFGCAIAREGRLLACEHNRVLATTDITAHAEITAVRVACRAVGDILLTGAIVATTCEPCPMCMAALHWARVETVYYGASISDAAAAGFNELHMPAGELLRLGESRVKLRANLLNRECCQLFAEWNAIPGRRAY